MCSCIRLAPPRLAFFLAICGVSHPLTIIIWFNKVVVVVVVVYTARESGHDRFNGGCDCSTHVHSVNDNYSSRRDNDKNVYTAKKPPNFSRVFCVILLLSTLP